MRESDKAREEEKNLGIGREKNVMWVADALLLTRG